MRWVLAEFSNSIMIADIMKELSQDFLNLSSIYPTGSGRRKPCKNVWTSMSVAFRGSTLSQLHTLSFQLLFQKFYLNGFTDVYIVKWNLTKETCSTVSASFRCQFLYFMWIVCPKTSALWRFWWNSLIGSLSSLFLVVKVNLVWLTVLYIAELKPESLKIVLELYFSE